MFDIDVTMMETLFLPFECSSLFLSRKQICERDSKY